MKTMKDMSVAFERKKTPSLVNRRNLFPSSDVGYDFNRAIDNFAELFNQLRSPLLNKFDNLSLYPNMDIIEDETTYKIELEMPGMNEEDIKVSLDKNALTITGEKTVSKNNNEKNYLQREINYGFYEQTLALPDYLDTDHATASFKKGMLWVVFPKNQESMTKKRDLKIETSE